MIGAVDMAKESFTVGARGGVEAKHYRPKTAGEARALVREIFAKQGPDGWDERSQQVYMRNKGVEPKPVGDLSVEDLRALVRSFELNRMVIFHD